MPANVIQELSALAIVDAKTDRMRVRLRFFYAATDGVLTSIAGAALPMDQSGNGLSVLGTTTNLARLASLVIFGLLWSHAGTGQTTACCLLTLAVAMIGAYFVLNRPQEHVR